MIRAFTATRNCFSASRQVSPQTAAITAADFRLRRAGFDFCDLERTLRTAGGTPPAATGWAAADLAASLISSRLSRMHCAYSAGLGNIAGELVMEMMSFPSQLVTAWNRPAPLHIGATQDQ